ncbi:hypothetical protein M9H77_31123 [Catharanthus roseus]|uniref:Uncharacterized protein n=1 Tax=Catharanthus roseus TaxID=4058 RepID=A0ACB9ZZJ5_CATRO|nr:hypothetical protein M9H77_31123 [Catharanthus roseus]
MGMIFIPKDEDGDKDKVGRWDGAREYALDRLTYIYYFMRHVFGIVFYALGHQAVQGVEPGVSIEEDPSESESDTGMLPEQEGVAPVDPRYRCHPLVAIVYGAGSRSRLASGTSLGSLSSSSLVLLEIQWIEPTPSLSPGQEVLVADTLRQSRLGIGQGPWKSRDSKRPCGEQRIRNEGQQSLTPRGVHRGSVPGDATRTTEDVQKNWPTPTMRGAREEMKLRIFCELSFRKTCPIPSVDMHYQLIVGTPMVMSDFLRAYDNLGRSISRTSKGRAVTNWMQPEILVEDNSTRAASKVTVLLMILCSKRQRIALYVASPPYEGRFQWRGRFRLERLDPLEEGRSTVQGVAQSVYVDTSSCSAVGRPPCGEPGRA